MIQFLFLCTELGCSLDVIALLVVFVELNNDSKLRKKLVHIMHTHKLTVTERAI